MPEKVLERKLEERIGNVWSEIDTGRRWRTVEGETERHFPLRKTSEGKFLENCV